MLSKQKKTEIKQLFDSIYRGTTDTKKMKLSQAAKDMSSLLILPEQQIKNFINENSSYFEFENKLTTKNKMLPKQKKAEIKQLFDSIYRGTTDTKKMKLLQAAKDMSYLLKLPEQQIKNYINHNSSYFEFQNKLTTKNKRQITEIFNNVYKE